MYNFNQFIKNFLNEAKGNHKSTHNEEMIYISRNLANKLSDYELFLSFIEKIKSKLSFAKRLKRISPKLYKDGIGNILHIPEFIYDNVSLFKDGSDEEILNFYKNNKIASGKILTLYNIMFHKHDINNFKIRYDIRWSISGVFVFDKVKMNYMVNKFIKQMGIDKDYTVSIEDEDTYIVSFKLK